MIATVKKSTEFLFFIFLFTFYFHEIQFFVLNIHIHGIYKEQNFVNITFIELIVLKKNKMLEEIVKISSICAALNCGNELMMTKILHMRLRQ